MTPELKALIDASTSQASKKALTCDMKIYEKWAEQWAPNGFRLPATESEIAEFVAFAGKSRAASTVTRYVSSLSRIHDQSGMTNHTKSQLVRDALRGLKRSKQGELHQAPALSGEQLLAILASLSHTEWAGQRNRAVFAIGWACALRCSELHALDLSDIDFVRDESDRPAVIVRVRKSKTDQERIGKALCIPASPLSEIVQRWVKMLASLYVGQPGPLFPRFSKSSRDRYFPRTGVRERLSIRGISKMIGHVMTANGLAGSVHSLRRGMITEAARCNVPERIIQRHSRHRSTAVLRSYIEEGTLLTDNPLPAIFRRLFRRPQDQQLIRG